MEKQIDRRGGSTESRAAWLLLFPRSLGAVISTEEMLRGMEYSGGMLLSAALVMLYFSVNRFIGSKHPQA